MLSFGGRVRNTGRASTGGKMFMIFRKRAFFGYQLSEDSSGIWFVNLPHSAPMTLTEARAVAADQWLSLLREGVADDRTPALDLLRRTEPADLLVIGPMEDVPTVPAWSKGRMVLIGDAAHPPRQVPVRARRWPSKAPYSSSAACAICRTGRRSPPTSSCAEPASRRSSRRRRALTATRPPARSPAWSATSSCPRP